MLRSALVTGAVSLSLVFPSSAGAEINGIFDNNLPLLTPQAEVAFRVGMPQMRHSRLMIEMGTDPQASYVKRWFAESRALGLDTMIAVGFFRSRDVTVDQYRVWLRSVLRAYPQIRAIEATNEPDGALVEMPKKAAEFYRVAKGVAGKRLVLAGGTTDSSQDGVQVFLRKYIKALGKSRPRAWAIHYYGLRTTPEFSGWFRRATRVKRLWITETGVFSTYSDKRFNASSQVAQTRRVVALSKRAERTYWTGFEACHGCRLPDGRLPRIGTSAPPPVLAPGENAWDTYLLTTRGGVTTTSVAWRMLTR